MSSSGPPDRFRLFIALPLPPPVKEEIARLQNELRQLFHGDAMRWTKPAQFHLTLKFLGDVAAARIPGLIATIGDACSRHSAMKLRAQGLGCFPNARFPRVVWVAVLDDTTLLSRLQKNIEEAAVKFIENPRAETFSGHVTIARIKEMKRSQATALTEHLEIGSQRNFGEWIGDTVEILKSDLSESGATHSRLATFPLRR